MLFPANTYNCCVCCGRVYLVDVLHPYLQVALIAEEISGIGNEIQRQLLRTRRSFTSTVLSADGEAAGSLHAEGPGWATV
jgi:hypothetical protein